MARTVDWEEAQDSIDLLDISGGDLFILTDEQRANLAAVLEQFEVGLEECGE